MISLLLILAIIIAYGQVKNFDFVGYDDQEYVTENSHVQEGITVDGIIWAFTTFHAANWHPLTWLSHMLDCELYGLNPVGHHWTNLTLHVVNTILLFLLLKLMTGAIWRSAFVAALFALHPLHVESVAWVSERKDVLSTFFGLLMIYTYCRYVDKSCFKTYLPVIIFLCLGLMAKPMLVTIPFVLLLLDFWPLKRFQYKEEYGLLPYKGAYYSFKGNYRLIVEKIPLFIPVVISCILTFFAQKSDSAVKALVVLPLKTRITNALVSYVSYIKKTIWPHKLSVFYPHPGKTLPSWQIVGAILLIVVVCFIAIRSSKKYPYMAVGLFWYLGTLVPVIGLVQVGDQAMADRYTYVPLIGIFIAISWGASDMLKKWNYRNIFLCISAVTVLFAFTARTFSQTSHWKSGITLFEHAIKITENNYIAHNNLATSLGSIDLDRAISHYKEALKIFPNYAIALENLGIALSKKGNYDEAVLYLTKALKVNPQKTDTRMKLANVLFLQAIPEKAISQYKEILNTDSKNADAHYNLANIMLKQGKLKESFIHYAEAIKIKPDYVQAYNKIGLILFKQGKFGNAKVFFSKALEIDPDCSEAHKNLEILKQTLSSSGG
jgi:tetratricopeptide (TPR) repeat protein